MKYHILLAEDHILFRQTIRKFLERFADLQVVGEAGDGLELLEILKQSTPDLIILDISMPNLGGIEATRQIKLINPEIKVLIMTLHKNKDYLHNAISAGAEGYVLKEVASTELLSAITIIRGGGTYISPLISS